MPELDAPPRRDPRRLAVRVTNDALRQIRSGHPWVFDRSITSAPDGGAAGDLAVVFDDQRRFAAIGLFDPDSPIRIRVLHHGKPATIDRSWWAARLDRAIATRSSVIARDTTGYRVVHGENDGMPGLVLDRYGSTSVIKLYSAAWFAHLADVVEVITERLKPDALILRLSRDVRRAAPLPDGTALIGEHPNAPVLFREHGLVFEADVVHGQKTGHFLDQRDNRFRVGGLAKGRRVLDVFSCTGGFSVHAAAGGATSVLSVDQSTQALATAAANMAHNARNANVARCRHVTEAGDAFEVMKEIARQERRFGVVVVDPPSFARKQADHDRALHAYRRLTGLAIDLVEDGGVLVQSSCSSRVTADEFFAAVHGAANRSGVHAAELVRTTHAADHPIGFPEGAYLKTLFLTVRR